jgi:hypothetical protein
VADVGRHEVVRMELVFVDVLPSEMLRELRQEDCVGGLNNKKTMI